LLESQLDAQGKFWFDGFRSTITELSARLTSMVADRSDRGCGASQVELSALIGERCQALSPLIREKSLQINYPNGKLWLPSDAETFSQVVDNLLFNAIAFSPAGGHILWGWEAFDQEVLITLRDGGPGLQPGEEHQIFCSGYTRRPGGQGQGLAIAKRIVTHLGGRIWAETLEVGGAQFSLVLPLTPRPA
ncbi:MAG: HAMP domain-containing sensor histidine kinase, partial [Cyanobacteria bacterium P01_C01_bin.73]